jgi:hypothetical protein
MLPAALVHGHVDARRLHPVDRSKGRAGSGDPKGTTGEDSRGAIPGARSPGPPWRSSAGSRRRGRRRSRTGCRGSTSSSLRGLHARIARGLGIPAFRASRVNPLVAPRQE